MKIMYYELIKMLISHDKRKDSGIEMTERLQRYLNKRLLNDVETLKSKSEEKELNCLNARLRQLEERQEKLERSNKELRETNQIILSVVKTSAQPDKQVRIIKSISLFFFMHFFRSS